MPIKAIDSKKYHSDVRTAYVEKKVKTSAFKNCLFSEEMIDSCIEPFSLKENISNLLLSFSIYSIDQPETCAAIVVNYVNQEELEMYLNNEITQHRKSKGTISIHELVKKKFSFKLNKMNLNIKWEESTLICNYIIAICTGHYKFLEYLYANDFDFNIPELSSVFQPFNLAVLIGDFEMVKFLLRKKVNISHAADFPTPLSHALKFGYPQIMKELICYGENIYEKNSYNKNQVWENTGEMLQNLEDDFTKISIGSSLWQTKTLQYTQCFLKCFEIIKKDYISKDIDFKKIIIKKLSKLPVTLWSEMFELIFEDNKPEFRIFYYDLMLELMEYDINNIKIKKNFNITSYYQSLLRLNSYDVIYQFGIIINSNEIFYSKFIYILTNSNLTPDDKKIICNIYNYNEDIINKYTKINNVIYTKYYSEFFETILDSNNEKLKKLILLPDFNINEKNYFYENDNALHFAIKVKNLEAFKILVLNGMDIEEANTAGVSLLHTSITSHAFDFTEFIISNISLDKIDKFILPSSIFTFLYHARVKVEFNYKIKKISKTEFDSQLSKLDDIQLYAIKSMLHFKIEDTCTQSMNYLINTLGFSIPDSTQFLDKYLFIIGNIKDKLFFRKILISLLIDNKFDNIISFLIENSGQYLVQQLFNNIHEDEYLFLKFMNKISYLENRKKSIYYLNAYFENIKIDKDLIFGYLMDTDQESISFFLNNLYQLNTEELTFFAKESYSLLLNINSNLIQIKFLFKSILAHPNMSDDPIQKLRTQLLFDAIKDESMSCAKKLELMKFGNFLNANFTSLDLSGKNLLFYAEIIGDKKIFDFIASKNLISISKNIDPIKTISIFVDEEIIENKLKSQELKIKYRPVSEIEKQKRKKEKIDSIVIKSSLSLQKIKNEKEFHFEHDKVIYQHTSENYSLLNGKIHMIWNEEAISAFGIDGVIYKQLKEIFKNPTKAATSKEKGITTYSETKIGNRENLYSRQLKNPAQDSRILGWLKTILVDDKKETIIIFDFVDMHHKVKKGTN